MFEFIRIQCRLGKLTAEQVRGYAPKWITPEQAEQIVAEAVPDLGTPPDE